MNITNEQLDIIIFQLERLNAQQEMLYLQNLNIPHSEFRTEIDKMNKTIAEKIVKMLRLPRS